MRTVEGSGPENSARGFPLHGINHWDGPACAGGPSAFIFVPSVSRGQTVPALGCFGIVKFVALFARGTIFPPHVTNDRDLMISVFLTCTRSPQQRVVSRVRGMVSAALDPMRIR